MSSFLSTGIKGSFIAGSNKLSASSLNDRSQEPHIIGYPDGWRTGKTEAWYKSQPTTTFTHLQYRKEHESPFYHEFVVAELDNNTLCRFDRRGDVGTRANAFTTQGITAEDSAHVFSKSHELSKSMNANSDMLLRLHFPQGRDLLSILSICYAIQHDGATKPYDLFRFNCYFFSWTIITCTIRATVDWAVLCKNTEIWKALVKNTMDGLTSSPSRLERLKTTSRAIFGLDTTGGPALPAVPQRRFTPFLGSGYLVKVLCDDLDSNRSTIQQSLTDLLFRSTIKNAILDMSHKSAKAAATLAARNHAAQAACDTSMEAVIQSMWPTILENEAGGQLWEDRCRSVEECVRRAADAAADAAIRYQLITPPATPPPNSHSSPPPTPVETPVTPIPKANWEDAWNAAWAESWAALHGKNSGSGVASAAISQRSKTAWHKAWREACRASGEYVPVVSCGVADFVMQNLPEAPPEVLKIEATAQPNNVKFMIKAFTSSEGPITTLQEWIQKRIVDHCNRVANVTAGAVPLDSSHHKIEDAMRRVWVATVLLTDQTP
ncbi:hypothetical protein CTheo_5107 [Ceratobasidium theobromae]|uniref:Uncharacterized protein n=1 Tax=Ceratobasidium theobromae TaxID=1582974 RepID=A0A5N5QI93_9AGAM|nr:hypothetical protein CTheo_5107 [Ceratobasidium theobromae]